MGPALLIALQSAIVPAWFPPVCQQPATTGYALVEIHDSPAPRSEAHTTLLWIEKDGSLWMRDPELLAWNKTLPAEPGIQRDGASWHNLASISIPYRFDSCSQSLWVSPPREAQALNFGQSPTARLLSAQPGGFLNFDFFVSKVEDSKTQYSGIADLGVASGYSFFRGAWVADQDSTHRLDSAFTVDNPDTLHRLRLGDGITRTDQLGTAVRYGGIRWGTEFALQPEITRFPLPLLNGDATMPSTVELYVNGVLSSRTDVQPGPFTVVNPPVYTGNGDLQVVVRDALGNQTVYSQPFYVASQALTAGTADYDVEAGWQRHNFALSGDHYSDPFGLGSYRYGFSDRLTAGARLEVQRNARTLGGSALYAWPEIGQFSGGLSVSDDDGAGSGGKLSTGYERISRRMNFGIQASWSDPQYVELGNNPGEIARSLRTQAGLSLPNGASLILGYAEEVRRNDQDLHLTALSYAQRIFENWYLTTSYLHSRETDDSAAIGLVRALKNGNTVSIQLSRSSHETLLQLTWQHSPRGPLGWNFLASAQGGDREVYNTSGGYSGTRGRAQVTASRFDGINGVQAEVATGLAWLGSDTFWTRPVRESFAVAEANAPDVHIYRDNQLVGSTNANGRALVPDISSYEPTRVSLDPQDLPLDRSVSEPSQEVKIATGGARVTLSGPARRFLQVQLRLDSGNFVPAGALLTVNGQDQDLPVGRNGLVYLEASQDTFTIGAHWDGLRCQTGPVSYESGIHETLCLLQH